MFIKMHLVNPTQDQEDGEEWLDPSEDSSSDEEEVVYGDRVVDLGDIQLLDLQTETWLKCASSYPPLRGGVNAMFTSGSKVYLSGGMHSDAGARMPTQDHKRCPSQLVPGAPLKDCLCVSDGRASWRRCRLCCPRWRSGRRL